MTVVKRIEFAGVHVDLFTKEELTRLVRLAVKQRWRITIGHHNLHSVYLTQVAGDTAMTRFYEQSDITHVDGMGVIALARRYGFAAARAHRVGYLDWSDLLFSTAAASGWRLLFVGGRPGVGERAASSLRSRWPGLNVAVESGYFDTSSGFRGSGPIDEINRYQPDILLVGMGMPRQEHWVLENRDLTDASVVLTCGGFLDYFASEAVAPPRWIGQIGLEWLFRTLYSPRRLLFRSFVEPVVLSAVLLARESAAAREHTLVVDETGVRVAGT